MECNDLLEIPQCLRSNPIAQLPPFHAMIGENPLLISKTVNGNAVVTNFRFYVSEGPAFINIPLLKVGELLVIEAAKRLRIGCKDGSTYSCSFATADDCNACTSLLREKTGLPQSPNNLFAYRFYKLALRKQGSGTSLTKYEKKNISLCQPVNPAFAYSFDKEVERLGFMRQKVWRKSRANENFEFCPTYPKLHILPAAVDDDKLKVSLDFRALRRFPSVVWRDRKTGMVLIRSSQPLSSFLGVSYFTNHADVSLLEEIVNACNRDWLTIFQEGQRKSGHGIPGAEVNNSQENGLMENSEVSTPKQDGAQGSIVCDTSSIANGHGASNGTFHYGDGNLVKKLAIVDCRSLAGVWGNSFKGGGTEDEVVYKCNIFHLDLANIHTVRDSFNKLRALCHAYVEGTFLKNLAGSMWLTYISALLRGANIVVEQMQVMKRPVLVHCSDGWDRTSQIVSLSELMMDSYYRTLEGFQVLVEREWLHFGHKFAERGGHDPKCSDTNQISPIFLQFLDCVYQLTQQYPAEFQFNEAYLMKLVHHSQACLFGTFLYNCQKERESCQQETASVWAYLRPENVQFVNLLYKPSDQTKVLTAKFNEHDIVLWKSVYMAGLSPPPHVSQTDFYQDCTPAGGGEEMSNSTAEGVPRSKSADDLSKVNMDSGRRNSDPNITQCHETAAAASSTDSFQDEPSPSDILHVPEDALSTDARASTSKESSGGCSCKACPGTSANDHGQSLKESLVTYLNGETSVDTSATQQDKCVKFTLQDTSDEMCQSSPEPLQGAPDEMCQVSPEPVQDVPDEMCQASPEPLQDAPDEMRQASPEPLQDAPDEMRQASPEPLQDAPDEMRQASPEPLQDAPDEMRQASPEPLQDAPDVMCQASPEPECINGHTNAVLSVEKLDSIDKIGDKFSVEDSVAENLGPSSSNLFDQETEINGTCEEKICSVKEQTCCDKEQTLCFNEEQTLCCDKKQVLGCDKEHKLCCDKVQENYDNEATLGCDKEQTAKCDKEHTVRYDKEQTSCSEKEQTLCCDKLINNTVTVLSSKTELKMNETDSSLNTERAVSYTTICNNSKAPADSCSISSNSETDLTTSCCQLEHSSLNLSGESVGAQNGNDENNCITNMNNKMIHHNSENSLLSLKSHCNNLNTLLKDHNHVEYCRTPSVDSIHLPNPGSHKIDAAPFCGCTLRTNHSNGGTITCRSLDSLEISHINDTRTGKIYTSHDTLTRKTETGERDSKSVYSSYSVPLEVCTKHEYSLLSSSKKGGSCPSEVNCIHKGKFMTRLERAVAGASRDASVSTCTCHSFVSDADHKHQPNEINRGLTRRLLGATVATSTTDISDSHIGQTSLPAVDRQSSMKEHIDIDGLTLFCDDRQALLAEFLAEKDRKISVLWHCLRKAAKIIKSLQGCHSHQQKLHGSLFANLISEGLHSPDALANAASDVSWETDEEPEIRMMMMLVSDLDKTRSRCDVQFCKRKHHCRNCGKVFCRECSSYFTALPETDLNKPDWVCRRCHSHLLQLSPGASSDGRIPDG